MYCKNSTYCNCKSCNNQNKPMFVSKNNQLSIMPFAKTILVLDANNEPMPNVYVSNLTTQQGTITNFDGIAIISGQFLDTIEINHISHDVEQFSFGELPSTVKLSNPHNLDEVTVIAKPKQAGIGIALALAGLGLLFTLKTAETPKQGLKASKALKVTL